MEIKEEKGMPNYRELIELINSEWPAQFGDKNDYEKIKEMEKSHNKNTDTVKYLIDQNKIIGWYRYSLWPRDKEKTTTVHAFDISIVPSHQKKGLGTVLMNDMIQDCKNKGIKKILSRSFKNNPGSIKLHQSIGFTEHLRTEDSIVWEYNMLKNGIRVVNKKGLHYIVKSGNNIMRFKPWLGDFFSFLYDFIMKSSIFPKKFGADMSKHYEIFSQELKDIHGNCVLELAKGSGSAVNFLPNDNQYTGTDISPGLLGKAVKSFRAANFKEAEFYVTSADDLPFDNNIFSICLCILSLNFFNDVKKVFKEIKRVLVPGAVFICSVPVPERNRLQSKIRGTLYSEEELGRICKEHGFRFESIPFENGALLYFRGILQ